MIRLILSAHVTDVVRRVHLNLEAVRIKEFERFLRITTVEFQVELPQFCAHVVRVEARNSEVIVIDSGGLTVALLNAKEAVADSQDVGCCGLLLQAASRRTPDKSSRCGEGRELSP